MTLMNKINLVACGAGMPLAIFYAFAGHIGIALGCVAASAFNWYAAHLTIEVVKGDK